MPQARGGNNNNHNPMQKKKKKGHKPAHQNTFAFQHNPKSKRTDKILSSPNVGVCSKCYEKIEWRKRYRKYKPLTQPAKCNMCYKRNILAAYHTICSGCAVSPKALRVVQVLKKGSNVDVTTPHEIIDGEESNDDDLDQKTGAELNIHEQEKDDEDNNDNNDNEHQHGGEEEDHKRVCAMCAKEYAMPDPDDNSEFEKKLQIETEKMEKKLGRALKLREEKALERKLERLEEREIQRLKDARRLEREEAAAASKATDEDEDEKEDNVEEHDNDAEEINVIEQEEVDSGEEDDDPFLKAIGGADKLLTGEAYQKMRLRQEEERKS